MGLEKAIEHKKEHRKKYRPAKAFSYHCRNHGGKRHKNRNPWECEYCKGNRLYQINKEKERSDYNEE